MPVANAPNGNRPLRTETPNQLYRCQVHAAAADSSTSIEEAARELDAFEADWGEKYRAAARVWRQAWANVVPFFQLPPEIRKITYTTNAIESLNMTMRKYTRNRRIFPSDESALKSLYLAIREASKNWRSGHHWKPALQVFQILFGEQRVPISG